MTGIAQNFLSKASTLTGTVKECGTQKISSPHAVPNLKATNEEREKGPAGIGDRYFAVTLN